MKEGSQPPLHGHDPITLPSLSPQTPYCAAPRDAGDLRRREDEGQIENQPCRTTDMAKEMKELTTSEERRGMRVSAPSADRVAL